MSDDRTKRFAEYTRLCVHIGNVRAEIVQAGPSREVSLALTKLDECALWLRQHYEENTPMGSRLHDG